MQSGREPEKRGHLRRLGIFTRDSMSLTTPGNRSKIQMIKKVNDSAYRDLPSDMAPIMSILEWNGES